MKKLTLLVFTAIALFAGIAISQTFYGAPVTGTAGASALVLNTNTFRRYLIVQNTGSTSLVVKFGSAISSSNEGIVVAAGGNYEPKLPSSQPLYIKALTGTPSYIVIEGN